MTEEEKKAVERLKQLPVALKMKHLGGAEDIFTVLNLIQKQQEEIEEQDKTIDSLTEKQQEREKYTYSLEAQLKKKDKIIDLMAEEIDKITEEIVREKGVGDFEFCDNKCIDKDDFIECRQCIKEFFEKRAEEN